MKELDEKTLDTAIALGDAVCNELGICCEKRGKVIFQVYKKLEEQKPQTHNLENPKTNETPPSESANTPSEIPSKV